jgi:CHASE2 domain-containing sensor protein
VRWTGRENPERVVYGVILIGALLAAESGLHDGYPATVASAAIGLGVFWLAHAYSALLGRRLSERERLNVRALGQALVREWAIVRGASIPLVALLVCWASGASQATGVAVAVWSAVSVLIALELLAGVAARAGTGELLLEGSVGAVMGLAILALKALATH